MLRCDMDRPAVPSELRPGVVFDGRYEIEHVIGQGGMGVVVRARHVHLDEHVAIKVLLPEYASDEAVVGRFLREGRAATRIRDEHVCRVFDVARADGGLPYMVLELLVGEDLGHLVDRCGPLPVDRAVDYVLQSCEALARAHALGIVHRDVKPENMFLTKTASGEPLVKVLDFGISKMHDRDADERAGFVTTSKAVMGSPCYMAPEQMRSARDVDARADVWSLGAVLFNLLAGRPPFLADSLPELFAAVLGTPPPPLAALRAEVPPGLCDVVDRCLAKDPAARCPSVVALARAIAPYGSESGRASAARIASASSALPATSASSVALGDALEPPASLATSHRTEPSWTSPKTGALGMPRRTVLLGSAGALVVCVAAVALWGGRSASTLPSGLAPASASVVPPGSPSVSAPTVGVPPVSSEEPSSTTTATATALSPSAVPTEHRVPRARPVPPSKTKAPMTTTSDRHG
jgi:eukaryotic-like serine/threonine-protein kinase